jgi:hypothetical protein
MELLIKIKSLELVLWLLIHRSHLNGVTNVNGCGAPPAERPETPRGVLAPGISSGGMTFLQAFTSGQAARHAMAFG